MRPRGVSPPHASASSPIVGVKRSVFLIDGKGIVRWRYQGAVRAIFKKPRELAELLESFD